MEGLTSLCVFISINLFGGFLLGKATKSNIPWYNQLNQPSFRPPNWLFGPVWTVLYIMIAVAGWRVYMVEGLSSMAMAVYWVQLSLNFVWTLFFFVGRRLFVALLDIGILWLCIVWCVVVFRPVDVVAAYLLVPYLCWVSFATCLNAAVWWLNPRQEQKKTE